MYMQWSLLLLCIASIWVHNKTTSAYMLMGGVAASRLGLWMFDLSIIQQMQVHKHNSWIHIHNFLRHGTQIDMSVTG